MNPSTKIGIITLAGHSSPSPAPRAARSTLQLWFLLVARMLWRFPSVHIAGRKYDDAEPAQVLRFPDIE